MVLRACAHGCCMHCESATMQQMMNKSHSPSPLFRDTKSGRLRRDSLRSIPASLLLSPSLCTSPYLPLLLLLLLQCCIVLHGAAAAQNKAYIGLDAYAATSSKLQAIPSYKQHQAKPERRASHKTKSSLILSPTCGNLWHISHFMTIHNAIVSAANAVSAQSAQNSSSMRCITILAFKMYPFLFVPSTHINMHCMPITL